jgi:glycosyltransferase involved in cell wall biosynthesis
MKKACIVTSTINYPGGVEVFNKYIEELLNQEGYTVDYCTADMKRPLIGLSMIKLIFGKPGITWLRFKKMRSIYDICIANGEYGFGIPSKNCINVFHGSMRGYGKAVKKGVGIKTRISAYRYHLEQYFGSKGKFCVAVSEYAKRDLERYGIKIHRVIVNCIDTQEFVPNFNIIRKKYLDVASKDFFRKGLDVLSRIANNLPNGEINLVINSNEKMNSINLLPNVDNSKMPEIYNAHKIFIFPSRYEAMQLAPLEAMACGVPVIISNVGLGPQLKEEIPDFVVEGYDDKAIKEYLNKINKILQNYDYYTSLARQYVLAYHTKDTFFRNWSIIIKEVSKIPG